MRTRARVCVVPLNNAKAASAGDEGVAPLCDVCVLRGVCVCMTVCVREKESDTQRHSVP